MALLKKILNHTYRPLLKKYLSADRQYSFQGIDMIVRQGVFHPGFFFSTKFLLKETEALPLAGKTLLELGCGAGLISLSSAKKGAIVTASDISAAAIACAKENARRNKIQVNTVESDLFDNIPYQVFDYIIINPPYYRGEPGNAAEMAWYCGEHLEYFEKLFGQIKKFMHSTTLVLIVLSDDCEMDAIMEMAEDHSLSLVPRRSQFFWIERNFIFEVKLFLKDST